MVPHVLAALGRTHDPANVRHAVALAREAGFDSFNLDLIYGAVGESLDDWRRTLDEALALEPPHISAYGLTVEPGTPLADDPAAPPRRRRPGRQVRTGRRRAGGGRPRQLRDLELGPAGARVPAQPPLLDAGRLPRLRLRGALAPGRPALVERPHARALHRRRGGGGVGRGGGGDARRRDPPRGGAAALAADASGRPRRRRSTPTTSTGWWRVEGERVVLTRAGRLLANEIAMRLR